MRFWTRPKNVPNLLRESLSEEILDESLLLDYVKIEDYLMVALGIRPCSFLTIPAEFPNGEELGKRIDELSAEDLQAVLGATPDKKGVLIRRLKKRIRESCKKVVFASATLKTHVEWAKKLSLQTFDVEVRPSIHELYLFKDPKVKGELRRLANIRKAARERIKISTDASKSRTWLAFPEELIPEYLASVGELLGYPPCCVERYIHDRLDEGASVEVRVSREVEQLKKEGGEPDLYAYFARNFFPCEPRCRSASEIGRRAFDLLSELNPKLGDLYLECIRDNVRVVQRYPEITKQYRKSLVKKAKKLTRV